MESGNADISIDLDSAPAGGQSVELESDMQVSISYNASSSKEDFAIIMLAAQHLEAWHCLFASKDEKNIPSLEDVLSHL